MKTWTMTRLQFSSMLNPINTPTTFFVKYAKQILKIIWKTEMQRTKHSQDNLKKSWETLFCRGQA
jgi:hypothetical protein